MSTYLSSCYYYYYSVLVVGRHSVVTSAATASVVQMPEKIAISRSWSAATWPWDTPLSFGNGKIGTADGNHTAPKWRSCWRGLISKNWPGSYWGTPTRIWNRRLSICAPCTSVPKRMKVVFYIWFVELGTIVCG